jgi:hypothetical protein
MAFTASFNTLHLLPHTPENSATFARIFAQAVKYYSDKGSGYEPFLATAQSSQARLLALENRFSEAAKLLSGTLISTLRKGRDYMEVQGATLLLSNCLQRLGKRNEAKQALEGLVEYWAELAATQPQDDALL